MLYKDLPLKASYESQEDDLVQEFYIPVLQSAVSYDRIAGFFSSSSLAIAAQGIAGLISNGGKMRIITSPRLSADDIQVIENAENRVEELLTDSFLRSLGEMQSAFERDHIRALGWLLEKGLLEIRVAFATNSDGEIEQERLFHQKVGVLKDCSGDALSFSGSINETAAGWLNNIEEFKVFKEWENGQAPFFEADQKRFEAFWNGTRKNIKIIDIPQAAKEKLLEKGAEYSGEGSLARHYIKKTRQKTVDENLSLFFYQKNALKLWQDNEFHLLFEMATGTGKTRTALACVNEVLKREKRVLVVIACPQTTLSRQWQANEVEPAGFQFGSSLIVDGTNSGWRDKFATLLNQLSIGYCNTAVVYTTHTTSSNPDFIAQIEALSEHVPICFVGDEVHGLGAPKAKQALMEKYRYRIGLSATPTRWFDDIGTQRLVGYFGNQSFQFTIKDALTTLNPLTNKPFLVNYFYHPIFVTLSEVEIVAYQQLTKKIIRLEKMSKNSEDYEDKYESLLFARANIQKNAVEKHMVLCDVLSEMKHIENTLIFTSPQQIDQVMQDLKAMKIMAHRFTEKQGTAKKKQFGNISERQYLINHFKQKNYQALVAISCLDEGIDIPTADTAILMANSTNPREYVQRIGRVIRQASGKQYAYIYDFIVEPSFMMDFSPELQNFEKIIFEKELVRAMDMATYSINNATVYCQLCKKIEEIRDYGTE